MNARMLLAAAFALAIHLFGPAAGAAPVAYDFEGYIVRTTVLDSRFQLPAATKVFGVVVVDLALPPDQQLRIFPFVFGGLSLTALPGHPDNRVTTQTTSELGTGVPPPPWEIVTASANTGPLPAFGFGQAGIGVKLQWHGEPGAPRQFPPGAQDVNLAALTPEQGWRISFTLADASTTYGIAEGNITALRAREMTGPIYLDDFADGGAEAWTPRGGTWSAATGALRNQANTQFTSNTIDGFSLPETYTVSTDVWLSWGASGNTAGVLLNYQGPNDFYEVRLNAQGAATLSQVRGGVRTIMRTGTYPNAGTGRFSTVFVRREPFALQVTINGAGVFEFEFSPEEPPLFFGSAGVFASWNLARFDNVVIRAPLGPFSAVQFARFDTAGVLDGFAPRSGTWTSASGFLRSSANQAASIAVYQPKSFDGVYGISARITSEWSASGNTAGFVYDYVDAQNYREVRLSRAVPGRQGTLILAEVVDGRRREVFRAPRFQGSTSSRDLFVTLIRENDVTIVNDLSAFINVQVRQEPPAVPVRVGLFAAWNLVRFDDVAVYEVLDRLSPSQH